MKALVLLLFLACLPASAVQASTLRYAFTGVLNEELGELPAGTPFDGSWSITLPQAGVPFSAGPPGTTTGRQYTSDNFTLRIADTIFSGQGGNFVFVSTTDLLDDPQLTSIWPSGFSSDFSVSSGSLFPSGDVPDASFGAKIWRIGVTFNEDGQAWDDFALPTDAGMLNLMDGGVRFENLDASDVFGGITGITVTTVPLPPAWALTLAGLFVMATRRRAQRRERSAIP
jgi:hypothetical protein